MVIRVRTRDNGIQRNPPRVGEEEGQARTKITTYLLWSLPEDLQGRNRNAAGKILSERGLSQFNKIKWRGGKGGVQRRKGKEERNGTIALG